MSNDGQNLTVDLPPVELIRVGEVYFVRDGHHRISVTRALGQQEIEAVVIVVGVDGPGLSRTGGDETAQPSRPVM